MNFRDTLIQTVHIPCGDLSDDFVTMMMKSKIQLMINGYVNPIYFSQEYTLNEVISSVSQQNTNVKLAILNSNYDEFNKEYIMDFAIKFATPEDKQKYTDTDLESLCILPLVLEYLEDNGEFIVTDDINFSDTMERFDAEVAQWMCVMDLHGVNTIEDIRELLGKDLIADVTLGEVVYVVFDATALESETEDYELIDYI